MGGSASPFPAGHQQFYDRQYRGTDYAPTDDRAIDFPIITRFVQEYGLAGKKCLEVGCGRGVYQDFVEDYTGVDIADTARAYLHKPFFRASATELPFEDSTFDAVWTVWVLEHVPDCERALTEIRRVLKPGGIVCLLPAWQCRPWWAEGYPVRSYSDFGLKGKLIKASIPLRDSLAWRVADVMPRRAVRWLATRLRGGPSRLRTRALKGNFEKYWMLDSDAINWIEPYEVILWHTSRGDEVLQPSTPAKQFLVRTGAVIVRIGEKPGVKPEGANAMPEIVIPRAKKKQRSR